MNIGMPVLLLVFLCHSAFCKSVQAGAESKDYVKIEVPLQPIYTDSDGNSIPLNNEGHHQVVRSTGSCRVPQKLPNSNLTCVSYPSQVKCIQTCMFGYTFNEGPRRQMVCDHSWNKWTPVSEFENCEPFIDCGVTLSSGGKLKCFTHLMDAGAVCEISCEHYEDKSAVPKKAYECTISGNWVPELPFCARAGSGLALVPPPLFYK